jgi:group I intron endonuclease
MRKKLYGGSKCQSGVYLITNIINGKVYVGSAANSLNQRLHNHKYKLGKNKHENVYLQNAVNKYGIENFTFEILEEYAKQYVISMEQWWMNMLDSFNRKRGYNLKPVAGSSLGYKFTEEQKKNISRGIQKIGGNKGKFNPRFGTTISEEQKIKTKETWLKTGFIKPICLIDKELNIVGTFNTIKEAAKYLNCDPSLISAVLKNKRKTAKNHIPCYKYEVENKLNHLKLNKLNNE